MKIFITLPSYNKFLDSVAKMAGIWFFYCDKTNVFMYWFAYVQNVKILKYKVMNICYGIRYLIAIEI